VHRHFLDLSRRVEADLERLLASRQLTAYNPAREAHRELLPDFAVRILEGRILPPGAGTTAEVVAAYAHRADVPGAQWWDLLVAAERQIDLLGYAMLFLSEQHPRLCDLLRGKAAASCRVRIALADPASPQARERDAEEGLAGALLGRISTALRYLDQLRSCEGIELHLHATPL